jgi:RNA polymerase sigma factor (sigma-70 family)
VKEQVGQSNIDELLLPFLRAIDDAHGQSLLAQLLSVHAEPIIKKIISSKLRLASSLMSSDADDVQSEAIMNLLVRLQGCKADPQKGGIADFRNYVAVIAYRACYAFLRRKYPERHRLKNRLRYLLNHNPAFAIWESSDGRLLCGFTGWQGRFDREGRLRSAAVSGESLPQHRLAEALNSILSVSQAPVEIDELVDVMAQQLGIAEMKTKGNTSLDTLEQLPDMRVDVSRQYDQRAHMQRLWAEIGQLPARQRAALLLNLKDDSGRGCIALFQLTGVATLRQMAEVIGMGMEEFAGLWNDLPIEDARIADLLKLTRQQVINLRKSARERLARRLKLF